MESGIADVAKGRQERRNQLGEVTEDQDLTTEYWEGRWDSGSIRFHMPRVHPMLDKHHCQLLGAGQRRRVFVPLCGKTLDIKWLAEKGHDVVGNEVSELACRQCFEESGIAYTTDNIENIKGTKLQSVSDSFNITLYSCDFFDLSKDIIGQFDCIWDRGSLAAINPSQRQQYKEIMAGLMKPTGRYLLDTFLVDHTKFVGPPHQCSGDDIRALFGDPYCIEKLEEKDSFGEWQEKTWKVDYFYELVHLLTRKK